MRFNKTVEVLTSLTFVLQMILYMAIVFYAPALALSQVTGLSMFVSILATGVVCTIYTAIGGMKAVVWTDALQIGVMLAGLLALMIQAVINVGGFSKMIEINKKGDRMPKFDFDPNPLVRHTFWTVVVGGYFTLLTLFGSNQVVMQRYVSIEKLRDAQKSGYLSLFMTSLFLVIVVFVGFAMYATYHDCDPLLQGKIDSSGQMVAYFMMQTLGFLPGLPGLFVATIYSAALSTVSSGVNSLAAVILVDLVQPMYLAIAKRPLSDSGSTWASIILAVLLGMLTVGLAFLAGLFGTRLVQIALSIFGMIGGPILGIFVVAMLFPFVNSWGAGAGLISSLLITLWVGVGAVLYHPPDSPYNITVAGCPVVNSTEAVMTMLTTGVATLESTTMAAVTTTAPWTGLDDFYSLSYMWYSGFAVLISVVVSTVVSLLTCLNRGRPVSRNLLFPFFSYRCVEITDDTNMYPIPVDQVKNVKYFKNDGFDLTDNHVDEKY